MVYNNVVYNIPLGASQAGIHVYTGNNTAIYNNTVYNVASKGILIENGAGNIVKNNIAYRNGNNYTDAGVNTVSSNNSVSGIDPRFVDPTRGNFQIQSGSPVIDAAVAISVVTTDLTGSPRPQGPAYDIGAYEFTTATQSQAPAPPTGVRIVSN
jgi:parallel beta-helix repeat protein